MKIISERNYTKLVGALLTVVVLGASATQVDAKNIRLGTTPGSMVTPNTVDGAAARGEAIERSASGAEVSGATAAGAVSPRDVVPLSDEVCSMPTSTAAVFGTTDYLFSRAAEVGNSFAMAWTNMSNELKEAAAAARAGDGMVARGLQIVDAALRRTIDMFASARKVAGLVAGMDIQTAVSLIRSSPNSNAFTKALVDEAGPQMQDVVRECGI